MVSSSQGPSDSGGDKGDRGTVLWEPLHFGRSHHPRTSSHKSLLSNLISGTGVGMNGRSANPEKTHPKVMTKMFKKCLRNVQLIRDSLGKDILLIESIP